MENFKTIIDLEREIDGLEVQYELLRKLNQTDQIIKERGKLVKKICELNTKKQTLREVLLMMNGMQFVGAGGTEGELRSNITGEPIHQGNFSGN